MRLPTLAKSSTGDALYVHRAWKWNVSSGRYPPNHEFDRNFHFRRRFETSVFPSSPSVNLHMNFFGTAGFRHGPYAVPLPPPTLGARNLPPEAISWDTSPPPPHLSIPLAPHRVPGYPA